jgi:predicted transglutaminase-like cysteine proteinase
LKESVADNVNRKVKIWEPEEDNLLRKYYYEKNGNWREIA